MKTSFGHKVTAEVGNIPLSLVEDFTPAHPSVLTMCAISNCLDMDQDMLFSPEAYSTLLEANNMDSLEDSVVSRAISPVR